MTDGENESGGGKYGFFVHPGETVTLPFKYQSFSNLNNLDKKGNKFTKVCTFQ